MANKILTEEQFINRIQKEIPAIDKHWIKDFLKENTSGEYTENCIKQWVNLFKKLITE